MTTKNTKTGSIVDVAFDTIGAVIPSCGPALRLVEIGQERPLNLKEKFILAYNSPLCPHCRCNREKFDKERAKMKEISAARTNS